MNQEQNDNFIGKTCPYCMSTIKAGSNIVICPVCKIPHHAECWLENGKCSTFGCNYQFPRNEAPFSARVINIPGEQESIPELLPPLGDQGFPIRIQNMGLFGNYQYILEDPPESGSFEPANDWNNPNLVQNPIQQVTPVNIEEPGTVKAKFIGTGTQIFLPILLLTAIFYVPFRLLKQQYILQIFYFLITAAIMPFVTVYLNKWLIKNTRLSNGINLKFTGCIKEIWIYFLIQGLLSGIPGFLVYMYIKNDDLRQLLHSAVSLLLLPVTVLITFKIIQWSISSIKSDESIDLSFNGKYTALLGWQSISIFALLLMELSDYYKINASFTWSLLIPLAASPWLYVLYLKWYFHNIQVKDSISTKNRNLYALGFKGSGWEILWMGIVAGLFCLLVIPIPWVVVWCISWIIDNMTIKVNPQEDAVNETISG